MPSVSARPLTYPIGEGERTYCNLFVCTQNVRSLLFVLFCVYTYRMSNKPKKTAKGRPKKPPGEARNSILQVRLTATERKLLDDAANAKALDTSAWVRMETLALAKQLLGGT